MCYQAQIESAIVSNSCQLNCSQINVQLFLNNGSSGHIIKSSVGFFKSSLTCPRLSLTQTTDVERHSVYEAESWYPAVWCRKGTESYPCTTWSRESASNSNRLMSSECIDQNVSINLHVVVSNQLLDQNNETRLNWPMKSISYLARTFEYWHSDVKYGILGKGTTYYFLTFSIWRMLLMQTMNSVQHQWIILWLQFQEDYA